MQVDGGRVTVRCTGRDASLRSAAPSDGWRVEVELRGPEQVKVRFTTAAGGGRESEVEAECEDGTPVFSTSDDERRGDSEGS
ncbi:hypothetical protein GCM10027446_02910 [Angustibacter peucedani]